MRLSILAALAGFFLASPVLPGEAADTSDLKKKLLKAIDARSNDAVRACLKEMVGAGGKENIDAILKVLPKIPETEDAMYWDLVQGACSFRDTEAMEFLGDIILKSRGSTLSRDLIFGLAKNPSPASVLALIPALKSGPPDLQLMAAVKIGTILVPEAVDALVDALKREESKDTDLREACIDGLRTLTGQDFGINVVNWAGWWSRNRDKPLLGPKARDGGGFTGTVVDHLDGGRKKGFVGLEAAPKGRVVVLSAEFPERDVNNDHIEEILDRMGIPHTIVKRPDFEKYNLRGVGAIIVNCAQFHKFCICPTCKPGGDKHNRLFQCTGCNVHKEFSAKLSDASIKKLQAFVLRGGFLFLEDWTVKEVLERAFPQYATAGKVLKQDKVDVVPARGRASHPFLKGVFRPDKPPEREEGGEGGEGKKSGPTTAVKPEPEFGDELVKVKHEWIVDDESWAFKISNPAKVIVLLQSGRLQKVAEGQSAAAFFFRPGGDSGGDGGVAETGRRSSTGLVMQVLSHFGKQASEDDEYALQNILVNFLIAANAQHGGLNPGEKPAKKKAGKEEAKKEEPEPSPEPEPAGEPGE